MPMQVILTTDVAHLGAAGELVTVKNGFGRNYLLPQGMAVSATERNRAKLEHDRAMIARKVAREREDAQSMADRLNGMTLQFERVVGDDDKMFGSVGTRDLVQQLKVAGLDIEAKRIKLDEPVKALGKYEVEIKLRADITATLKFWVVAKE